MSCLQEWQTEAEDGSAGKVVASTYQPAAEAPHKNVCKEQVRDLEDRCKTRGKVKRQYL